MPLAMFRIYRTRFADAHRPIVVNTTAKTKSKGPNPASANERWPGSNKNTSRPISSVPTAMRFAQYPTMLFRQFRKTATNRANSPNHVTLYAC